MVVLVVGPDCAGKTNMVTKLSEDKSLSVVKVSPPFAEKDYDDVLDELEGQLKMGEDVVWDRIPLIDDFVYSHAVDRRMSYYEASGQLARVKRLLRRCVIIHVKAKPNILLERAKVREGECDKYVGKELRQEQLKAISREYEKVFEALDVMSCAYEIDTSYISEVMAAETLKFLYERLSTIERSQKIAHIVPVDSLYLTVDNEYHMCLAQLCNANRLYKEFFKKRAAEGKFVLLDNGAAEGTTTEVKHLFELAQEIGAKEVVLPDKLQHMAETIRRTKEAYDKYVEFKESRGYDFGVMIVPQGIDYDQWKACAERMVEMFPLATSYGIPKVLAKGKNDPYVRFRAVAYLTKLLMKKGRGVEIHLLGCNEPPVVISAIFHAFPNVRGIDSAFAHLCAKAGTPISNPYVERPDTTIEFVTDEDQGFKLELNMQMMNKMLVECENGVDFTWGKDLGAGI